MRHRVMPVLISSIFLLGASPASAGAEDDALGVLAEWTTAFNAGDAGAVAGLYAADATVFGTLSPTLVSGDGLKAYFAASAKSRIQVRLVGTPSVSKLSDNVVVLAGIYEFSGKRPDGEGFTAPARYSLVVVAAGGKPVIVHQHSSPQSKPPQPKPQ